MSVYLRSFIKINKAPTKFNEALTKPNHGKLISDIILIIIVNNYTKKNWSLDIYLTFYFILYLTDVFTPNVQYKKWYLSQS